MQNSVTTKLCLFLLLLGLCSARLGTPKRAVEDPMLQQLAETVNNLQARLVAQEQEIAELKAHNAKKAAFSAHIHASSVSASPGSVIPFATVDTNVALAYDNGNFTFIAPYDGDYFFIITLDVSPEYEAVSVERNGHTIIYADKDDRVTTHLTGSTVVTLKTGDEVRAVQEGDTGSLDGGPDCTFSGFLIRAD